MNRIITLSLLISCLVTIPACKKPEQNSTPPEATSDISEQVKQPQNNNAQTTQQTPQETTSKCPENPNDPDGLYRNFFNCSTPYPMLNEKAAKYTKSWKKGDEGAEMDGYVYENITAAFIDDYKKNLENAGFVNDRPKEAPPVYLKRINLLHVLRVDLADNFCKDWIDGCDHNQKIGQLTIQTSIMEYAEPEPPAPLLPALNAEDLKAAYNHPADPQKLYAGLPKPCIFPIKDGKAIPYADKTDLLDLRDYPDDPLFYAYGTIEKFDAADYVESHFYKQLNEAGFKNDEITTKDGYCRITMEGGEGEFDLRYYIKP